MIPPGTRANATRSASARETFAVDGRTAGHPQSQRENGRPGFKNFVFIGL